MQHSLHGPKPVLVKWTYKMDMFRYLLVRYRLYNERFSRFSNFIVVICDNCFHDVFT